MSPTVPRPVLIALGPVLGSATVVASLRGNGSASWFVTGLALIAAGGLAWAGHRGGDGTLALGLGAVGVAVGAGLVGDSSVPAVVLWAAGAVAAGEATGLARRTRSVAVADTEVVAAEATWSAVVVAATLGGGLVLLGAGGLPGPDGLVGEVIALAALVGLGALLAATPTGRTALRSLLTRTPD